MLVHCGLLTCIKSQLPYLNRHTSVRFYSLTIEICTLSKYILYYLRVKTPNSCFVTVLLFCTASLSYSTNYWFIVLFYLLLAWTRTNVCHISK